MDSFISLTDESGSSSESDTDSDAHTASGRYSPAVPDLEAAPSSGTDQQQQQQQRQPKQLTHQQSHSPTTKTSLRSLHSVPHSSPSCSSAPPFASLVSPVSPCRALPSPSRSSHSFTCSRKQACSPSVTDSSASASTPPASASFSASHSLQPIAKTEAVTRLSWADYVTRNSPLLKNRDNETAKISASQTFSEPPLSTNSLHSSRSVAAVAVAAPSSVEVAPSASVGPALHFDNCATSSGERIEQRTERPSSPSPLAPLTCPSPVDESQDEFDPVQYLEQLVSSPPPGARELQAPVSCPATRAPSAREESWHPKWLPAPAPSEPRAVSVSPAAQCPMSADSRSARSSSPMKMLLAALSRSTATQSSQVASLTLDQDAASSRAADTDAAAAASLCARVSSSSHCDCLNPVPFMPFSAVPLNPPPGHMLDSIFEPIPAPASHPLHTSTNGELYIPHTSTNAPTVELLASTPFSHRSAGNQKASDWIQNNTKSSEVYLSSLQTYLCTLV